MYVFFYKSLLHIHHVKAFLNLAQDYFHFLYYLYFRNDQLVQGRKDCQDFGGKISCVSFKNNEEKNLTPTNYFNDTR